MSPLLMLVRKSRTILLVALSVYIFFGSSFAAPSYITRFTTLANGGLAFTGNALGLSKLAGANQPGTSDSIGAFITTDNSQAVGSYPASLSPPAGTTLLWQSNSSTAYLDLPAGSTVLYAELIWGGSYGFGGQIPYPGSPFIPDVTSVTMITPQNNIFTIAPDPATAQQAITPGFTNPQCGNYTRTQNVTNIIQAAGAGLYVVGGVPGTVIASDDTHNVAGWTLAVAYSNPNMVTSNLTIFVGCQQASNAESGVASASGFCAPPSGIKSSRLFVTALEGDYAKTGDHMRFGPTSSLTPANDVSGTNNPINNFFNSQVNTLLPLVIEPVTGKLFPALSGLLDTRGSYGLYNFPVSGVFPYNFGRQGVDITSVDVTSTISYNQTQAFAQGTTTSDDYTIIGLGMLIEVGAPILETIKKVNSEDSVILNVGDIATFTGSVNNMGTSDAVNCVLKDILQAGLSFVSGSFKVNNVAQPDPDLVNGYPFGNLAINDEITFEFQVSIDAYPSPGNTYVNDFLIDYDFVPCLQTAPIALESMSNEVVINFCPLPNSCDVDGDCTGGNACTAGACVNNTCSYTSINCQGGDQCNVPVCNALTGCTTEPLTGNTCGDPLTCSSGTCANGICQIANTCTALDTCRSLQGPASNVI